VFSCLVIDSLAVSAKDAGDESEVFTQVWCAVCIDCADACSVLSAVLDEFEQSCKVRACLFLENDPDDSAHNWLVMQVCLYCFV